MTACMTTPLRRAAPACVVLIAGTLGMLGGLVLDARDGAGLPFAAALCSASAGAGDWAQQLTLHWRTLPAMHIGMVSLGLVALPVARRVAPHVAPCRAWLDHAGCCVAMLAGMTAGALASPYVATLLAGRASVTPALLFATMLGGMIAATLAYAALARRVPGAADGQH